MLDTRPVVGNLQEEIAMATLTYFVALAFMRSEVDDEIVACEPKEARSAEHAVRLAGLMALADSYCGAIAFSRTGDPAIRRLANLKTR
jgi:hypothetical protein